MNKTNRVMMFTIDTLDNDELNAVREVTKSKSTWEAYRLFVEAHPKGLTSKDLEELLPESTTYRVLNTLKDLNLIQQDGVVRLNNNYPVRVWKLTV